MKRRASLFAFHLACAVVAWPASAEVITDARYEAPVDRYGHFALGRPHEYARVTATTDTGRQVVFSLPQDEVFEDLAPRIVMLAPGEARQLLTVISQRDTGARLVILALGDDELQISAQSAPIGTPMRWLNPVGVADLDADGRAEIAAVITPHLGGLLKIYRKQGSALVEIGALGGFSNHVYGSVELALSTPMSIAGTTRLLVPDATRLQLRVVGLKAGQVVEIGRCALTEAVAGPVQVISPTQVSVGLASGRRQLVSPGVCVG